MVKKISSLEKKYKGLSREIAHEAALLVRFFNLWPEVQVKILIQLGLSNSEIKRIMNLSDNYALKKIKIINERIPNNRKDIIIIENDAIEMLYKPRIMMLKEPNRSEALKVADKWLKQRYKGALIMDSKKIEDFEDLMNHEGRSIDFLVFDKKEILSYAIEVKE